MFKDELEELRNRQAEEARKEYEAWKIQDDIDRRELKNKQELEAPKIIKAIQEEILKRESNGYRNELDWRLDVFSYYNPICDAIKEWCEKNNFYLLLSCHHSGSDEYKDWDHWVNAYIRY